MDFVSFMGQKSAELLALNLWGQFDAYSEASRS